MPLPFLPYDDHTLFPCLNVVLVGYALLLFAPRWKLTPSLTLFIAFVYCLMYTFLLIHRVVISDNAMGDVRFDSLDAIIALFADSAVLMAGWTHYIALDFFVARYAVLDSQARGISHIWMFIVVPVTLFAAPVGFVLYYLLQQFMPKSVVSKSRQH